MKQLISKAFLGILTILIFSINTQAQDRRIGLSTGFEMDMIQTLDKTFVERSSNIDLSGLDLIDAYSSSGCENTQFRIFTSLPVSKFKNTSVYAAFIGIFNRSDRISFTDGSSYYGIGTVTNELAMEFSLDKRLKLFNFAYLDLGMGNNLGLGYGGYSYSSNYSIEWESQLNNRSLANVTTGRDIATVVVSNQTDYGRNEASINGRVFGKVGAGVIFFKKVEVGLAFRYGLGARLYENNYLASTQYNSFEFNSAFRF